MSWKKTSWFWKSGFAVISVTLALGVSGCSAAAPEETEIQEEEIAAQDIEDDAAETLFKIAEGRTDPILAVTFGRLKVEGNIDKALKLKDLINSKKKKGKKSK